MRIQTSVLLLSLGGLSTARVAGATVINITPSMTTGYTQIEAARAGDEVIIAPGTYHYKVFLGNQGTASAPIRIHAQDPSHPPVWDLGNNVPGAPGDYTAGDRNRGCWQIAGGAYYDISDLVIQNCSDPASGYDSAGLRYYWGSNNIRLSNMLFQHNDNGLTGGSEDSDATVEFCEFNANGTALNANTDARTHNIYIYGGTFALRYSYVHDSGQGANFHIRAKSATLEYNWFARAQNYEGDLMTDDDATASAPIAQTMLLRGNVFIQSASPGNASQVIALSNDSAIAGETFALTAINNTFIGNGGHAQFVHLSNADGTKMTAELDNNVLYGTSVADFTEMTSKGTVTGQHNWLPTGATVTGLSGTVFGSSPGFKNASGMDYTLASGSMCIGAGNATLASRPTEEYYENQTLHSEYRIRGSAKDIGAFESTTTGPGLNDGVAVGTPDAGSVDAGHAMTDAGSTIDAGHATDAGTAVDAGHADAGSTVDAGHPVTDAGQDSGYPRHHRYQR